jgi:hypothetical protein
MMRLLPALTLLAACNEYRVYQPPPPPPAEPPGFVVDAQGVPPSDWNNCSSGHFGLYFNLHADHPLVAVEDTDADVDLAAVDFWTEDWFAFQRYDPSIDWGANWWPVDDGLEDDPNGFAVQWTSWIRVFEGGTHSFVLGAADDVEVRIDGQVVASEVAALYEPTTFSMDLQPGQYPVRIRYAQRLGDGNGFRFRLVSPPENAKLCYPEFPEEE